MKQYILIFCSLLCVIATIINGVILYHGTNIKAIMRSEVDGWKREINNTAYASFGRFSGIENNKIDMLAEFVGAKFIIEPERYYIQKIKEKK